MNKKRTNQVVNLRSKWKYFETIIMYNFMEITVCV